MHDVLLITHLVTTAFMTGLIWLIQLVHYPLFEHVGQDRFVRYHARHLRRTTWIVAPVMLTELAAATALVVTVGSALTWAGLAILVVIWMSTILLQVPAHRRLSAALERKTVRYLVATNWVRTVGWSGRAVIAVLLLSAS